MGTTRRYHSILSLLLGGMIVLCLQPQIKAQIISTQHGLSTQAQLLLFMDGLESSWEVMGARAAVKNLPIGPGLQDAPIPSDEILAKELRLVLGDIKYEYNPRVREFIQLFARQKRSSTEAMMGMAGVYNPVISRHLTDLHLPAVLAYLPAALSAFHLRAISEDGSTGLWQLNYYAAARQGLVCNATVDERMDIYKSTKAALTYLAELNQTYKDWSISLAAYSCGPAGIARARNRAGSNSTLKQLYPFLPEHGRDNVAAFAAVAYVMTHAKQLGLKALPMEVMALPDRIQLQEPLRFALVAKALGISEIELRNINPVCRTEIIPGINMPVQLCLPQGYGSRFAELKDSIYTLQAREVVAEKKIEPKPSGVSAESNDLPKPKPTVTTPAAPKPYAPPAGSTAIQYTIKSGDNVGLIAQWHGISIKELKEMNGLSSDLIKAGDQLTIFVPKAKAASLGKVNSMSYEEKQAMVGAGQASPTPKPTPVTTPPTNSGAQVYHTVKSGENLWIIAKKFPGVTAEDIMKANGISESLQPGMTLKIPKAK